MSTLIHNFSFKALLIALVLGGLGLLATLPLSWSDQLIIGIALYAFCVYLNSTSRSYRVTLILILLSLFCTTRYCIWRYLESWRFLDVQGSAAISVDLIFVVLLLGAETYAAVILALGYFQGLKPLERKPIPLPEDTAKWPTVDVFIPTYNEPLEIVKPTVMAALNMDYPPDRFQVYILDDGRRDEFRQFAEQYGVTHVTRADNRHAKAGNINAALKNTSADLVAIFDCDHVPTRSFLQLTVGWFLTDQKLGMVQTPHHFYSPDPFEKNLDIFKEVPNESSLFYGIVQDGNDFWNAAFFCGSCAVIRRPALAEIGGVAVETVTEDAHTSLRMQRKGWGTAYINIPQAAGLATSTMADHIGQRIRWARGMVQILRVDTPLFGSGLTLAQRLCYFNSVVHYLYSLPRLIFLTAPLVYLLLGYSNMYGSVSTILAYALPHLALATLTNSRIQGRHRHSFWNEVYETVLAPFILLPTMAALINPKWGKFNVTSKSVTSERTYLDWHVIWPFALLLALNIAGIIVGVSKVLEDRETLPTMAINIFWSTLNVVVLGASVAAATEKRQLRSSIRVPAKIALECVLPDGRTFPTVTLDISTTGLALSLQEATGIRPADLLVLRFLLHGKPVDIPAFVISSEDSILRVVFHQLTLDQEEKIALLMFSGADFWNRWRRTGEDRPLYSFLRILEISTKGLMAIPASLFGSIAEASKGAPSGRASRRPVLPVVVLFAVLFALLTMRASGQPVAVPPGPGGESKQTFDSAVSFRDAGRAAGLSLRGREATAAFDFSIPVAQLATEARLDLRYRLAPALNPEASRLEVQLNGSPAGAVLLKPSSTDEPEVATLTLPAELLTANNQIQFHLLAQCEDCSTKDERRLITQLEASSAIVYSGAILPVPNRLELLPQLFFDPAAQAVTRIGVHFSAPPSREMLTAAGVAVSWFGIQAERVATEFHVSIGEPPPGNMIWIADRSKGELAALRCPLPEGQGVAICPHPADPSAKILVIFGDSGTEALQATRAFVSVKGLKGESFSAVPSSPARLAPYEAPRWLRAGTSVRFAQFSSSDQFRVAGAGSTKLYFRLPPDLHFATRSMVPLRTAFRWRRIPPATPAKLRVSLNGTLVARRSYREPKAGELIHETLQVSVSALYPRNTLTFELEYPELPASVNPEFEIDTDSTLDLRGVEHFTEMPRLDLFAKAGFPFTRRADLAETAIALSANASPAQMSLALNAVAFLSSQTGSPATWISFINTREIERSQGKDILMIGTPQDQFDLQTKTAAVPLLFQDGSFRLTEPKQIYNRYFANPWFGYGWERAQISQFLGREGSVQAVLQGAELAAEHDRSLVQLLAASDADAFGIFPAIEAAAATDDIFGNVSLQRAGNYQSFRLTDGAGSSGNLGLLRSFDHWMTKNLLFIPFLVLLCVLPLAPMIETFVERRRKARLQYNEELTV